MTCSEVTISLGAYALGALDDDERRDVQGHLDHCPACRAELAEFAELPAVLSRLTLAEAADGLPPPPPEMYDRLAARATEQRRRGSRRRLLAAVAAALVLLGGTGAGIGAWAATRSGTPTYVADTGRVHLSVRLTAEQTGTGLDVAVSGLPAGEHCRLVAVAHDGSREVAGAWDASYAGRAEVRGTTAIPLKELTQVVVVGSDGRPLVTVGV